MISLEEYWMEMGGLKNGFFSRKNIFKLGDPDFKTKYNNFISRYNHTDVYSCVYLYDSEDIEKANLYGPFYLDLDGDINNDKGYEELKKDVAGVVVFFKSMGFNEDDIKIYFSGSKGFHVIISPITLGIMPNKDLNLLYKAWAVYLNHIVAIKNIDLRIYDRKRLFRIPNTINGKTGLYKIRVPLSLVKSLSHEDMCEVAKFNVNLIEESEDKINKRGAINFYTKSQNFFKKYKKQEPVKVILPETKKELLPCVKVLLETGAEKGYRNNTLVLLANSLFQSGYNQIEVYELMKEWNKLNDPPLKISEVDSTVKSAYAMVTSGKHYGCSAFKDLGLCTDENCRIGKRAS